MPDVEFHPVTENEEEGAEVENRDDWEEIFRQLDSKDGESDGRISKVAFLEWLDTLSFQDSISIEASHGVSRGKIRWLLDQADADDNKFIDKTEFLGLVQRQTSELEKLNKNKFHQYLRVAAYADTYRWWPPPFFILSATILELSVYLYHVYFFSDNNVAVTWAGPTPFCSYLIYNPTKRWEAWRFLTYCLVHSGVEHILINLLLQLLVGLALEMSNSWWNVGLVYMLGVLAGSLGSSVFSANAFLCGASGGVYALAAAHIASIALNWKEDSLILRQRLRDKKATSPTFGKVVRIGRLCVVGGIIGVDIVSMASVSGGQTSHVAHLMGILMGVLVGLVVLENRKVESWEKWVRYVSWTCATVFLVILVGVNIFATNIFLPPNENATDCFRLER